MMTGTPTNYRAWRTLDWGLLIFFAINSVAAAHSVSTKIGREDWTNWLWMACSFWATARYWERLFGKRAA